jgi:hypothetical protein
MANDSTTEELINGYVDAVVSRDLEREGGW